MNVQRIKQRASEVLVNYKDQYLRILIIVMLLNLVPTIFSGYTSTFATIIYYIVSFLFLTVSHGYIVSSLKMVRNNGITLSDDDAFVGFRRIKDLFPTYLLQEVISVVVMIIYFIICIIIFAIFGSSFMNISYLASASTSTDAMVNYILNLFMTSSSFSTLVLMMLLIGVVLMVIVSLFLFAVPYLLEEYHMGPVECVKESFSMMKGHLWDLVRLDISFWGWMILVGIIEMLLSSLLSFVSIGGLIASIIAGIIAVYTYVPRYQLSIAIFFEELAYYRYNNVY
ncbi:MAG: DUF975 family protein [Erysipelotrichaceae bacterium]|nr:DUF975 family protein [Erysipelotrichaceae bacterium]